MKQAIPNAVGRRTAHGAGESQRAILAAQRIEQSSPAPYHRFLYSASHCQSRHNAEHPCKPSASSRAAPFHITARCNPPVPTVSASSQASRSGPPMWVSFVRHAVAHGTSCVAHPWPVPAAPSERWPILRPTAPPPHPLWSPRGVCPALAPLCCRSTLLLCTPAYTAACRVICLDLGAIVS